MSLKCNLQALEKVLSRQERIVSMWGMRQNPSSRNKVWQRFRPCKLTACICRGFRGPQVAFIVRERKLIWLQQLGERRR